MKLVIAGGGTGGHVFPALAIAREWLRRGRDREVVMVGTERGLEAKLVPAAGLPLETIRVAGLKGIGGFRLLRNLALLPVALAEAARLLRRHRPAVTLGVGGYASGPVLLLARMQGLPTVIFEPNAAPGFTNRLLGPLVDGVVTAFPQGDYWGARARQTGCPVREQFFRVPPRRHRAPFTLLITGGSQGAQILNRTVVEALPQLERFREQLFFIHQTGERDYNAVREAYAARKLAAEVVPFIEDMAQCMARADLLVSRAGAVTLAEIAAAGRAAILVPFGAATEGHQLRNAQWFATAGAARLIPQEELTAERLAEAITALLTQPEQITALEQRVCALARPRAAEAIVDFLEEKVRR
ncbi:MAG: undecaprenyldiphospho-muramoylpentapeptide beta-N-acetylglucosaminyltransferase [Firmicutes bacterium]|nr:undecaprenyldiphospho-muramoylpentapeptide beta-N-acetylglucosaminyltransferase [Bacillota bacterium]